MLSRFFSRYPWLILIIAGAAVYLKCLDFEFLNWDDMSHLSNPAYASGAFSHLREIWAHSYYNLYIPVTYSIWFFFGRAVGTWIGAPSQMTFDPLVFHGANVLVHLVNAVLVFKVLEFLIASRDSKKDQKTLLWAALVGAMVFTLHPLQTEAVAWISTFRDLLAACFALIATNLWLRSRIKPSAWQTWFAIFAFLLSVLSKPSVVALPALLFILDVFWLKSSPWKKSLISLIPFFILSAFVTLVTASLQTVSGMNVIPPMWARPLIALDTWSFYLQKLVAPFPLIPDYGRNPRALIESGQIYWTWIPGALVLAAVAWFRAYKTLPLLAALFIIAISPVLGLMPFRYEDVSTVADHYVYFPLLFVGLGVSLLYLAMDKWGRRFAIMAVIGFASMTFTQLNIWQKSETLETWTLEHNPRSFSFLNSAGDRTARAGDFAKALEYYVASEKIEPNLLETKMNIGVCLYKIGKKPEAIQYLKALVEAYPMPTFVVVNLAEMMIEAHRSKEALPIVQKAAQEHPGAIELQTLIERLKH